MDHIFTEEQLAQIANESRNAADKALHRYVRQARIAFVIILAGVGFSLWDQGHQSDASRAAIVQSGRVVSVDGCNRDFHSISKLRTLLVAASNELERQYRHDAIPGLTRAQYIRARKFYRDQLEGIPLPDCRHAKTVVTSNPNAHTRVPVPLYPKKSK